MINKDILLCDLDAFFASVEQRENPELQGKPVLVGGSPEGRGVVSTCSYEARKYGVHSAMPMKKALLLCPHAIVLRGNMSLYQAVSIQVGEIFERFTPDIEFVSIDEAYLALPPGQGFAVGEKIHRVVKEELKLPISVGVSVNKLLAKIACEQAKPDAVGSFWPDEVPLRLWPLPVRVLPGVGPSTEIKLKNNGIKTVADLAAASESALNHLLGSYGTQIYQYAHGIDPRDLECEHTVKSISEETTFPKDIYDRDYIYSTLLELSGSVGYRLRKKGFAATSITLKLRFSDFRTITRGKTLPEAVNDDRLIYRTASELFNCHQGSPPWRLVGIQASNLEQGSQLSLFSFNPEEEKAKKLTETRDYLREKYGPEIIFQAKKLSKKKNKD